MQNKILMLLVCGTLELVILWKRYEELCTRGFKCLQILAKLAWTIWTSQSSIVILKSLSYFIQSIMELFSQSYNANSLNPVYDIDKKKMFTKSEIWETELLASGKSHNFTIKL